MGDNRNNQDTLPQQPVQDLPAEGPPEEDRSGLREAILAAAREMFTEVGYEATTMRKIAEHIGYSATTLYLHFPDKHAIVSELVYRDFAALGAVFNTAMAEPDPVARLGKLGRAYAQFGFSNPNHYRLMFMTRKADVQVMNARPEWVARRGDPSQDAYAALIYTVREAIASGVVRPELTDAEELAQMLWASLHGLVSLYLDHCHDDWVNWRPVRELTESILRMTLGGMVKPELQERYMGGA